jgi:hypothetical protein
LVSECLVIGHFSTPDFRQILARLGDLRAANQCGKEPIDADLRYDIKLQNAWIEIIRREGVRSLAMVEEINGCPHEEGQDYPLGEVCPGMPILGATATST